MVQPRYYASLKRTDVIQSTYTSDSKNLQEYLKSEKHSDFTVVHLPTTDSTVLPGG